MANDDESEQMLLTQAVPQSDITSKKQRFFFLFSCYFSENRFVEIFSNSFFQMQRDIFRKLSDQKF